LPLQIPVQPEFAKDFKKTEEAIATHADKQEHKNQMKEEKVRLNLEDYFFETIRKAANEIVIEGYRYWEAKEMPDISECREEKQDSSENEEEEGSPW